MIKNIAIRMSASTMVLVLAFSGFCNMKGKAMVLDFADITQSYSESKPMKHDTFKIKPGGQLLPLPLAKPNEMESSGIAPFSNAAANSRFNARLLDGKWSVKVQGELDPNFPPVHIVGCEDRIIVISRMHWYLFDITGALLARAATRFSPIVVEPKAGLFVFMDPAGMIVGHRLSDGQRLFRTMMHVDQDYIVTYLALRKSKLTIGGLYQFPGNIDDVDPAMIRKSGIVEIKNLGDSISVDDSQTLLSASSVRILNSETDILVVASTPERYVLALENVIYIGDGELALRTQLTGEFVPLAMSLDEAGRIHLISRRSSEQTYWLLSEKGEILFSMTIPEPGQTGYQPPIVGFDHSIYIPVKNYIVGIQPDGKGKLEYMAPHFSGAIITSDNKLLVSDGEDVITYDNDRKRKVLCNFAGETLRTPPFLTENGMIWVATDTHLYGLKPAEK